MNPMNPMVPWQGTGEPADDAALAAQALKEAKARGELEQTIVNYWCRQTGRKSVDWRTIATVIHYVREFGVKTVLDWIALACVRTGGWSDVQMGKSVSGIRRAALKERKESCGRNWGGERTTKSSSGARQLAKRAPAKTGVFSAENIQLTPRTKNQEPIHMPQRFLRPGITHSERWNSLAFDTQSFFVRLLTVVDDFGHFDARVAVLHAQCFALRPDIVLQRTAAMRAELQAAKIIEVYAVDGRELPAADAMAGTSARGAVEIPRPTARP